MRSTPSFGDRFSHLLRTVHPRDRGPYTLAEVSSGVRDLGYSLSSSYLSELRSGAKSAPSPTAIQALAEFFKVSPAYFFDTEYAEQVNEELAFLVRLRESDFGQVAARAAELSPRGQRVVAEMVDHLREAEGLDESKHDGDAG